MRRLIWGDCRRILGKKSVGVTFILALLFLVGRVTLLYEAYDNSPFAAVAFLIQSLPMVSAILSVVIFNAVYADDFKSMSFVTAIGRGIPRKKVVIAKLMVIAILMTVIYTVMTVLLNVLIVAPSGGFNHTLTVAWYTTIYVAVYKSYGYIALASLVLYLTNNIPLGSVVLILLHIVMEFATQVLNLIKFLKPFHLDRLNYAGLADNAAADFMIGAYGAGVLKLLFGLGVYLAIVIIATNVLFEKKELEF